MKKSNRLPLVSVIVPTYNSEKTIHQCLQSIKKQSYKNIETIVVDRNSTDKTAQITHHFQARLVVLDSGRSEARNRAARAATGEFILFIDSDMTLDPKVIEESVAELAQHDIHGVIIAEKYVSTGSIGECRKTEKQLLSNINKFVEIPRFFRRDVFLALGGYDEELVLGEDFQFFQRFRSAGYKTGRIAAKLLHSEGTASLFSIVAKTYTYGKSLPLLVKKSQTSTVKRYAAMRLASFKEIGTQIKNLNLLCIFFLTKTAEYLGYFLGLWIGLISGFSARKELNKLMVKIQSKSQILLTLGIFTVIALVIFRNFLFTNELPAGNDVFGWISRHYIFARENRWLYVWRPYSFGFVEGISLLDFAFVMTNSIFVDAVLTIKVFLFLSFLLAGFSMYAFAYSYTHCAIAAFSASLIYTLNQWFFSQLTEGHVDIIFSFAFAPLLFLLVDQALKKGKLKSMMFSAAALAVFLTGFHPNCLVIYGVFLALFLSVYLLFPMPNRQFISRSKRLLKFTLICGTAVFLLTAFFTIPFLMNTKAYFLSEEYKYPIEEAEAFSAANLTDAFTLDATEEGGYIGILDIREGFGLPDFPVQTLLLFVLILAYSVILFRRDRYTLFFLLATIISTFIAKGTNSPVGGFFMWAWFNIPHFAVFRRPDRWEMMTVFSNAFFVAVFVSFLFNYVIKNARVQKGKSFSINVTVPRQKSIQRLSVSVGSLSKLTKNLHKFLKFTCVTLIIVMILSGLLSGWFFFYNGLLTYKTPKDSTKPFQWIAEKPGNYKIVTVNSGPLEWANDYYAATDFAFCRMLTDVGWIHDLGFDSALIHDKPVLQDGGWEPLSKTLVDYARRRLANDIVTDDFLKIFGLFNYKYIVIPSYASERIRGFFLNQQGGQVVFNESDSVVTENSYFTEEFFSPQNYAVVIDGLEAFPSLCKIDSFELNKTGLVFANSEDTASMFIGNSFDSSKAVILANQSSLFDAVVLTLDSNNLILAKEFAVPSMNLTQYWISSTFWRDLGKLVLGRETLTTHGKSKADIPFGVTSSGEHEIWIRLAFAPDRGKVSLYVDDDLVEEIVPEANYWIGLKWIRVSSLFLNSGNHVLTLKNDGNGYNDIDAICVASESMLQTKLDTLIDTLQSFSGRLVYLFQPEEFFESASSSGWMMTTEPYEGNVLLGENTVLNIASEGNSSASSTQFIPNLQLDAKYATDSNLTTRWASSPYESAPQWLQINWTHPRELAAAKVIFETAYPRDYQIQVWDDVLSTWLSQVNVTENNDLVSFHMFEKPVNTTKIRLYAMGLSDFSMMSVWEFEAYEKSTTLPANLSVSRQGRYQCFVRASPWGNGKIYLKSGEQTSEVLLNNSSRKYEWFDAGVFNLTDDAQELSLGVLGKIGINQIIFASLSENESNINLSELFASSSPTIDVKYEKLNSCTYNVHINATVPFLLVFSESYNPAWKAYTDQTVFSPIPIYSVVNGFFINKTGDFTLTVYFTGQTYVDAGLEISLFGLFGILIIILTPAKKAKKLFSKITLGTKKS